MKVLLPFVGDTIGGSHHSAALLMTGLPAFGVEPICLIHRPGPLADFFRTRGIETIGPLDLPVWEAAAGSLRGLAKLAMITPSILAMLRKLRPDIVHVNDGRMTITWAPAASLAKVPLLVHQRTKLAPSRLTALALSQAGAIVANSRYTLASLPSSLLGRTTVVDNPFAFPETEDRQQARSALRRELGLEPDQPILVCIGTLQLQKRPRIAISATARLRRRGFPAVLLLVGRAEGKEAEKVAEVVANVGLGDAVKVLGFRSDIHRILSGCDLLLAPAVDEGHGRALVEALLARTPVVAADTGGHREVITHGVTGMLVEPDQPDGFAEAAASLLTDSARARTLADSAYIETIARYSVDRHCRMIASIYQSMMTRK